MRILFVTQEIGKVPSGVLTVVNELYKGWNANDNITLLINKTHWLEKDTGSKLSLHKALTMSLFFYLPSELSHISKATFGNFMSFLSRLLIKIIKPFYLVFLTMYLVFFLRKHKINGILSHNGGWPGGELNRWIIIAGKISGVKEINLVIHNVPKAVKWHKVPFLFLVEKFISFSCTNIITVSDSCKRSIQLKTFFDKSLIVINNGISLNSTEENINCIHSLPWLKNKKPVIGFIGELSYRKGIHILLEAIVKVTSPCSVIIVGSGDSAEYVSSLKTISSRSKHDIYFLGFIDNASEMCHCIDLLILPSLSFESFGMTIIEAMMYKKPVICSDYGGMKEVVKDGVTGIVVEADNVDNLAVSIELLLKDEEKMDSMGRLGYDRYKEKFDTTIMLKKYEKLF